MAHDQPENPAAAWPPAEEWPPDDAPPAVWAKFYRDRMGWVVLPTPGLQDTIGHARSIARRVTVDFVDRKRREPTDAESESIWREAREQADAARKGPIGYFPLTKFVTAADVTDKWIATFWEPVEGDRGPRGEADQRGICIRPSQSSRGLPAVLVDVDPRHGGDVGGPWGAGLPGPKASTASGEGVHTFVLAAGDEHTSQGRLAPGVDVVARGGFIVVPAGSATPARRWISKDPPAPSPAPLRKPPPARARDKRPPRTDLPPGTVREPGDDDDDTPGRAASLIAAEIGDGERNDSAADIVGILARPRACPDDFVRACLEMLAEDLAGRDTPRGDAEATIGEWRSRLTRGPRDADFAAEVLGVWARVRHTRCRPWSESKARQVARSMWKTCDRREGGHAGAEDFGVGPVLAHAAPTLTPPGRTVASPAPGDVASPMAPPAHDDVGDAVPYPPPPPGVQGPTWRGGIDPRSYIRSLGAFYTDDHLERDLKREPIQIAAVVPAIDFLTGKPLNKHPDSLAAPLSMGWGEDLARALGGMSPGDFRVIGAAGAGAGKTWFECWLAHGLAIATASRLLGVKGYEDRPIVLPIWVSEMPKRGELYMRACSAYLGFDMACITAGRQAHDAPGVRAMAEKLKMTPYEVVDQARLLERLHGAYERSPLCVARHHVIKVLSMSDLPRRSRKSGIVIDHRSGPALVDHLADAVDVYRRDLADLAGVPEDEVLPLMMIDPAQRFTGDGESEKRAIDALFGAVDMVLCQELGCAVLATSDTTKLAVRESADGGIDRFLSRDASALGADIFAGSYGIIHHASDVIAVAAEPTENPLLAIQWARILKARSGGAASVAYPFGWDKHLGRFTARPPEPLRRPAPSTDQHRGGSPPPPAPMGHGGLRLPPPRRDRSDALAD